MYREKCIRTYVYIIISVICYVATVYNSTAGIVEYMFMMHLFETIKPINQLEFTKPHCATPAFPFQL